MSIAIYQACTAFAILIVLLIATYFDCQSRFIPIILFPMLPAVIVPLAVASGQVNLIGSLFGLLVGVGTFWALAYFFDGGGGDIIMMGALGWCLGLRGIIILILISSLVYTLFATAVISVYAIKKRTKETLHKQYPFAPFVLAGYIICVLSGWLI